MKPDTLSVHDLFQRERRYIVPLYQRAYVWSRDEQWEPLWEDIERQANACLATESLVSKRSHFLGAIVLNVSKIVGSGVARSEIIDGQQRLTTLQIFIAAIRDYAESVTSKHSGRLLRLTINEDEKRGSDESFKVWPTNADRSVFRSVQSAGSPIALLKSLGITSVGDAPRIAAAYVFFYERIAAFANADESNSDARDHRILGLVQALRTSLQLVVIELEESDDPQVIFETLNARGQPLLPSDLIRNYIFLQAANDSGAVADDLYDQYWRPFDSERLQISVNGETRFWHVAERQGRLTRPRIDLFLFHYLVMQTERDVSVGQLFREFRDWHDTHPISMDALLSDVQAHAAVFQRLVSPQGNDRVATFARRLKALDNSTVYPVLLYLLSLPSDRLATAARDEIIADLESWLVRRFICQMTSKNYNNFFVSLITRLKKAPAEANLVDVVRATLTRSDDPTTVWPSDEAFLASWLSKPLYAKSRPDRSAMVLRAIEMQARTSKNEAVGLPEVLSVEHLLPQRGTLADYPFPDNMPLEMGETLERCRERIINTIGNLTLLTAELNAAASNGPFPNKVVKIVEDSDLRLNAWLRSAAPQSWSESSILKRGEELFRHAVRVWPRGDAEPENVDDDMSAGSGKGVWRFTDEKLVQATRDHLLTALGARERIVLIPVTVAKAETTDRTVRAVVAVSKRYVGRKTLYWYAYHPAFDAFLSDAKSGYLLLGCIDRADGFAIPREVLEPYLYALGSTTRRATGKLHWHIHLVERPGGLAMLLPKRGDVLELKPYLLKVDALNRQITP